MADPPSDIEAERYTLAAMMLSRQAIAAAVEVVMPDQFYRPAHQVIFRAMVMMDAAGERVDPVTLRAWLERDGDTRVLGPDGPIYLSDLFGLPANPLSIEHYARLVLAAALRRAMVEEGHRIVQAGLLPSTDPDEVLTRVDEKLEAIRHIGSPDGSALAGYDDVTSRDGASRRIVVPGLLDAEDRVVVVGGEGRGKTTLAHQVGFATAAGCHPFAWTQMEPRRVVIMDFENPRELLGRRFRNLGAVASRYPGWDPGNIKFIERPGGIDLTKAGDVFAMTDMVRRFEPSLIVCGPIYKMIIGASGEGREVLAAHARVTQFFDRLRERFGCAVWLEAHAPLGAAGQTREMRPDGSGLWLRWPEFGLALYKATRAHGGDSALDIRQFRGHREEGRAWPSWLTRNPAPGGWPWVANYGPGVLDAREPAE